MIDEENGGGGSSGSGGGGSGSSRAMVPHRRWVSGTVSGRRRDRNQRWKTREFSFRIYWTEPWSITYRDGGVVAVSSNVASVVQEQLRGILHRGKQAAVSDSMAITTTTARRLDDERGEMKEEKDEGSVVDTNAWSSIEVNNAWSSIEVNKGVGVGGTAPVLVGVVVSGDAQLGHIAMGSSPSYTKQYHRGYGGGGRVW